MGDVATVVDDGTPLRLGDPADGVQQGRLAGAVGAEQRDHLALVDFEVDPKEHLHVAVAHLELADEEQLRATRGSLGCGFGPRRRRLPNLFDVEIGRASGRERGWQYV